MDEGGAGSYDESGTPMRVAFDRSAPIKRLGKAEECADLTLFLASKEASYLNSVEFIIDGANVIQEMKTGPSYPPEI